MIIKKIYAVLVLVIIVSLCSCSIGPQPPYLIEPGAYGLQKAIISDLTLLERFEIVSDDIFGDKEIWDKWYWILNLSMPVKENAEYAISNSKWYYIYKGIAYEIVGNNLFKVSFIDWRTNIHDYNIEVILEKQIVYA